MTKSDRSGPQNKPPGQALEVLIAFLKLGLTSFGGPIAHLAYFRREFVERRQWISESQLAQLMVLCQFLPGPASSQLGFGIGLLRAGWLGALAAFTAFTLPSALLLIAFATWFPNVSGPMGEAAIHGLKLVALAVVAHGVLGMARRLCPDPPRATLAIGVTVMMLLTGEAWVQLLAVALGGLAGLVICKDVQPISGDLLPVLYSRRTGWILLIVFAVLLILLPFAAQELGGPWTVADPFYRAGALVFGGGHVVLPLLEASMVTPERLSSDEFLAGYGAAQAVPGPMFSLAAYLGARLPGAGASGAFIALGAIFLPGFLLLGGALPLWRVFAARPLAARAVAGVNAAVVGLLASALYDPVWTGAVRRSTDLAAADLAVALIGFMLFAVWRVSALWVVLWCVAGSLTAAAWL